MKKRRKYKKKKVVNTRKHRESTVQFVKNKDARTVFGWVFQIAVVLALAAVTSIFFFQSVIMQEGSMEPTFMTGEKFFVNKAVYKFRSPKRGDLIAFTKDGKDHAPVHIKRVIGLPGETILIKDGKIYIDGEVCKEEQKFPEITNPGLADEKVSLKSDEFFVLGDNRNNSEDSRFQEIKNVKKKYIEGKLWFRTSPSGKRGFIKH